MSLKAAIIATTIWMIATVVGSALALWYIVERPVDGVSLEDRASQLGSGFGLLTGVGLAIIWLPAAARLGRQRRAARRVMTTTTQD